MRNKKIHVTIIIIFIIIVGVSLYYILTEPINLGLDLKGGTQIILKPVQSGEEEISESKIELTIDTIMKRIDRLGVSEPLVTKDLSNNIVVQLPGVKDPDTAKEIIGKTARLEFRLVKGTFISLSEQKWDLVGFDYETGQLVINQDSEQVLLIDDISSLSAGGTYNIVGELLTEPKTGEMLLVKYETESNQAGNSEGGDGEESSNTGTEIEPDKIIGKLIYNQETRELQLVDYESGDTTGEVLVDSRSGAATLVGPVLLTGDEDLANAAAGYDNYGEIIVKLNFKGEGIDKFAKISSENIGKKLAIVLDDEIKSAPVFTVPISNGNAQIDNIPTLEEAKSIEIVLQTGALPVNLQLEESSTVGPTLGRDSLNKGLYAGIAGLILIVAFMISYYRGLGFVSTISLIIYIVLFWGIIAGIDAALTLPGIAGIILTIGMAVDANVIIFERIKEEIVKEKSPRVAIGDGFKHALRTIVDSNVTTLITAAALYRFGTGPIKGFAVTLSLGVVISMIISLLFTRSFLFLMSGSSRIVTPGFLGVRIRRSE